MSKPSAQLWLLQAESDLKCAERNIIPADTTTYCHAIAKYQQATEKAIKGLVVALKLMKPTPDHEVTKELRALILFILNPRSKRNSVAVSMTSKLFSRPRRRDIERLVVLSPKYPVSGEMARRNTEYPFQTAAGDWLIPAGENIFTLAEVEEFRRTANRTLEGVSRIFIFLQMAPHE